MHESPAHGPTQQQASPMSQMTPPVYGSPFGYPYGSPYYYAPGSVYSDGQHYYQPPAYPAYYSYPGSPTYDTNTASTALVPAASPSPQSYYGAYGYPYQYSPAPYWGMTSPTVAQQPSSSPATYYSPADSLPKATGTVADDRSATPTPAGHGAAAVTEDSLESE